MADDRYWKTGPDQNPYRNAVQETFQVAYPGRGGTDATGRMLDPTPAVLSLADLEREAARVMPVAAESGASEAGSSSAEEPYRGAAGLGAFLPFEFREREGGGVDATDLRVAVPPVLTDMVENFERLVDPRSHIGRTPEEARPGAVATTTPTAMDFGMLGAAGATANAATRGAAREAAETMDSPNSRASLESGLYNPNEVKGMQPRQRRFEEDYPNGQGPDGRYGAPGEKLTQDIDGRPLDPEGRVVGRRVVGGPEEALGRDDVAGVAEKGTGGPVASRPLSDGSLGETSYNPETLKPFDVTVDSRLSTEDAKRVLYHEVGHVIDQFAGEIEVSDLSPELDRVYSALNTGEWRARGLLGPGHQGYDAEAAPRELMAEAIRAYMLDPNWMKSVAPKTAARIREAVNTDPDLSKIIQFNMNPAAAGLPGAAATAAPAAPPSQGANEPSAEAWDPRTHGWYDMWGNFHPGQI